MKAEKKTAVNYTATDIETMGALYTGKNNKADVDAIAAKIGKSPASVRAKLANLGLYKKAEAVTGKKGGVKKEEIAAKIAPVVGLNEAETEALAKTTIPVLTKILAKLVNSGPEVADIESE
jgi:hypothetical protein